MTRLEDRIRTSLNTVAGLLPESHEPIALSTSGSRRRSMQGPIVALASLAIVIIGIGGVSLFLRSAGSEGGAASGNEAPGSVSATVNPVEGTVVDGSDGLCDPSVTRGTLYLGGPASEENQAVHGFLFSLPAGWTPIDAATSMVSQAIIGAGCEDHITGGIQSDPSEGKSTVSVTVAQPATASQMQLAVETLETGDVIGVTGLDGSVAFEVIAVADDLVLQLLSEVPAEVADMSVRFRKGDDVWELSVDPSDPKPIALTVPDSEIDRFPEAEPEWVLFTLHDVNGTVLDAGGRLIP